MNRSNPGALTPMGDAGHANDEATPSAWRRWRNTTQVNAFVGSFVRTCLLSLIAFGPIPRMDERRHH